MKKRWKLRPVGPTLALLGGLALLILPLVIFFEAPEFVDCIGVLEPGHYQAVVAPRSGRWEGGVAPGTRVEKAQLVVAIDQAALSQELHLADLTIEQVKHNLALAQQNRQIRQTAAGLRWQNRRAEADRLSALAGAGAVSAQEATAAARIAEEVRLDGLAVQAEEATREAALTEELKQAVGRRAALSVQTEQAAVAAEFGGRFIRPLESDELRRTLWPSAQPGQVVGQGQLLGYVVEEGRYRVRLLVPENRLDRLRLGAEIRLTFPAFPADSYQAVTGRVVQLGTSGTAGCLPVWGEVDLPTGPEGRGKPLELERVLGTSVQAKIRLPDRSLFKRLSGAS